MAKTAPNMSMLLQVPQGRIQDSQKGGGHKYIVVNMIVVCGAHDLACEACQI